VKDFEEPDRSLVFVTKRGQVKRTELKEYRSTRSTAIAAVKLGEGDDVLRVSLSDGGQDLLLVSKLGMSIRFMESEVNAMGRVAAGVRGIQLKEEDEIVAAEWVSGDEGEVLVLTELGYGKRSLLLDYPVQGRGGKGVATFEFKEGKRVRSNGERLIGALLCKEEREILLLTSSGGQLTVSTEKAPIEDRKSIGKLIAPVDKKDVLTTFFPKADV
jgi:topoisomerase-4 subunit A